METKPTNIRIDAAVKAEATQLFAQFGLGLSDAVNIFLRVSIAEQGMPFLLRKNDTDTLGEKRAKKFSEFLEFAKNNTVHRKGYKFDRNSCYGKKTLH